MRLATGLPAILIALASTGATYASSCSEQIATIERRLDSAGAERVTGKEPAGGTTSSASPKALDQPPGGKPSDPATTASVSGIKEARDLIVVGEPSTRGFQLISVMLRHLARPVPRSQDARCRFRNASHARQ